MKRALKHISPLVQLTIILGLIVVAALMVGMGCTDRLKGEVDPNQKPYVNFVNVPPDLQRFSRNPVINWYGSDVDGIIAYFRYVVVLKSDIGVLDPIAYVLDKSKVDSATGWNYLVVDPKGPDPQTSKIVKMSADMSDPIRQYIEQYVFLQAVDAEGAASDVVYRLFSRNDHPPQTIVFGYAPSDTPFVNSVFPGGAISGMPIRWGGSDPIDYPQDPPPFMYHWRVYGPYDSTLFAQLKSKFFTNAFLTRDAQLFRIGDTITKFDTTIVGVDTTVDTTSLVVARNATFTSAIAALYGADYGVFESFFDIDDTAFVNPVNPYKRIAHESSDGTDVWVSNTEDTLFNLFKDAVSDTTQQLNFIVWARSRDDAGVPDPVPAFLQNGIPVVDPKFERHAMVLDFTNRQQFAAVTSPGRAQTKDFFTQYVNAWEDSTNLGKQFDTTLDWVFPTDKKLFKKLLQHRVLILYNDMLFKSNLFETSSQYGPVLKAISGGVNCWLQMRCSYLGGNRTIPVDNPQLPIQYTSFFGIGGPIGGQHMYHSGWSYWADGEKTGDSNRYVRNESFKGARPLAGMESQWPLLVIDTGLLHQIYVWPALAGFPNRDKPPFTWLDTVACLPEVNWTPRLTPGTDPMYFFYSMYNDEILADESIMGRIKPANHPNGPKYNHNWKPVAHSFNSGFFKTIHMDFTLPAIHRDANLTTAFNNIMNYLWDDDLSSVVSEKRYPDSKAAWSMDDLRAKWKLTQEKWNADAGWVPEDATK